MKHASLSTLRKLSFPITASIVLAAHGGFADPVQPTAGKMAQIPGGTFTIGEATDRGTLTGSQKPHEVTVATFEMDVNLVTVSEYAACVQAKACTVGATGLGTCNTGVEGKDKHPINCVTHIQAEAYCTWAGKRLPTEAEWEYAARGGSKNTIYSWGDDPPEPPGKDQHHACIFRGNKKGTCEVGSYPAGAFGLFDMNGNVRSSTSTRESGKDGKEQTAGHIFIYKGGYFSANSFDSVHSSFRSTRPDDTVNPIDGIRCAK